MNKAINEDKQTIEKIRNLISDADHDVHDDDHEHEFDFETAFRTLRERQTNLLKAVIREEGWLVKKNLTEDENYRVFDEGDTFKLKGKICLDDNAGVVLCLDSHVTHISAKGKKPAKIEILGKRQVRVNEDREVVFETEFGYAANDEVPHNHNLKISFGNASSGGYAMWFVAKEITSRGVARDVTHHDQGGGVPH